MFNHVAFCFRTEALPLHQKTEKKHQYPLAYRYSYTRNSSTLLHDGNVQIKQRNVDNPLSTSRMSGRYVLINVDVSDTFFFE